MTLEPLSLALKSRGRGRLSWPTLARRLRRGAWAGAGALTGLGLVALGGWEDHQAHGDWQDKVRALRQATLAPAAGGASAQPAARAPTAEAPLLARLPAQRDAAGLPLALQQGLAQHGLAVQALRPQALQATLPLPSQTLALRLQGRWVDADRAWAALVASGPVWSLERLAVTPSAVPGQWQWDGVWRVWLRPDAPTAQAWPAVWTPGGGPAPPGADPFVASGARPPQTAASEPLGEDIEADPRQWPLSRIRLLGVWQQGQRLQAVLGAGPHWAVLEPGAVLAREGLRIRAVGPDAVELHAGTGQGPGHRLRLEGGGP